MRSCYAADTQEYFHMKIYKIPVIRKRLAFLLF